MSKGVCGGVFHTCLPLVAWMHERKQDGEGGHD